MFNESSDKKRPRLAVDQICSNVAASTIQRHSSLTPSQTTTAMTPAMSSMDLGSHASCEALNLSVFKTSHSKTSNDSGNVIRKHSWPPDRASTSAQAILLETRSISSSATSLDSSISDLSRSNLSEETSREKRRRQKLTNKDNLFCQVCGDKANGYNFGAITCESCKAFFRRNALKNRELRCNFDNACKIDHFTRKFCTACRLNKCFSVNMKKEWILDEDSLKKRKKLTRRPSMREEGSISDYEHIPFPLLSTSQSQMFGTSNVPQTSSVFQMMDSYASAVNDPNTSSEDKDYPPLPLNEDDMAEIQKIMAGHALIDSNQANDSPTSKEEVDLSNLEARSQDRSSQVLNLTDGFIRKLIRFVKTLPEYLELNQSDQITLLKTGIIETLLIRSAINQDRTEQGMVKSTLSIHRKCLKESFMRYGLGEDLYREHIKLITSFCSAAGFDAPTQVLLMIINLFTPDRPGLTNRDLVHAAEEHYCQILQAYLRSKHTFYEARVIYPQLLLKLTEIKTYGEICTHQIANVASTDMESLMREIFNMR